MSHFPPCLTLKESLKPMYDEPRRSAARKALSRCVTDFTFVDFAFERRSLRSLPIFVAEPRRLQAPGSKGPTTPLLKASIDDQIVWSGLHTAPTSGAVVLPPVLHLTTVAAKDIYM